MNVIITGASSGIGRELLKIFVDNGHFVIAVARRKEKLEKIKKEFDEKVEIICTDISKLENIRELHEEIKKMNIDVDLLINNAGTGEYGFFYETDIKSHIKTLDLNIRGLTYLTRIFAEEMFKKGSGGIINVASTASFQSGGPLMGVYYASKAYVLSFTEALVEEMEYRGVRIMALCPGPTSTDFKGISSERKGMEKFYVTTPRQVAESCYKDYFNDKNICIPGILNKILVFITRFIPRKVQRKIVRKIQEKKKRLL
ncbi:SDR family NAD(P)-dependent oxidoreductase [Ilyobacter polytropus]|uniref:Short-chain dehydrogenase/reductase SDR n=1 Tax=Ilyobacter polytropus (strain ATCC 51220 / DSM 2926 / LMG 16218 / CuHBu1) TaxID=572544 RepID=E3H7N4_ILYPC|nr:SDR family oxidoreductase [Ilyobacter polytropus]ADO82616.1 short-chain dehydrogenase/reductase SDR [Ilyobacter polytropus DSM 2926]